MPRPSKLMYYTVALLSPPYDTLTYARPAWWPDEAESLLRPGLRVAVPLGKSVRVGVLLDAGTMTCDVPVGVTLRPFVWTLEHIPLLHSDYMEMLRQCAVRQGRSIGNVLAHVLPKGLRGMNERLHHHADGQRYNLRRLHSLSEHERAVLARALAAPDTAAPHTARMVSIGDTDDTTVCVLAVDPPWPVRPRALRQKAVLDYLYEHGPRSRTALLGALRSHIKDAEDTQDTQKTQSHAHALDTLIRHGHVILRPADETSEKEWIATSRFALLAMTRTNAHVIASERSERGNLSSLDTGFILSDAQYAAIEAITHSLDANCAHCHLLFGVTGSGKTAVYIEIIRACHVRGKTAVLLAPEVAIALKLYRDVTQGLPHVPAFLYHGYQSSARRERLFRHLASPTPPCVVVGTRSALFLPLHTVGAVILDEEHDASYKQDEKLPYHAKEVAWVLASHAHAPLVLGSATPDVRTFHAARNSNNNSNSNNNTGRGIILSRLPERVGQGRLPDITLISIGTQNKDTLKNHEKARIATQATPARNDTGGDIALAPESLAALHNVLARGEQAVVLLNRRGYAPRMYCLECHTVPRCPHCEIALTYHKGRERLLCHYCGYHTPYPAPCVQCAHTRFLPMGEGTEKLAESLRSLTPLQNILRLDRDSTRRPGRMEEILESFARQEAQILVGTQMLSKGHHFPHVTLALLADGDAGLNLPDYRAAENTFQLLIQAAGRAGRGAKPGHVLIQTRDTQHYCWQYILRGDYEGFCEDELARRARRLYPPFVRLALIRLSYPVNSPNSAGGQNGAGALAGLADLLRREGRERGLIVLGPAPAPIPVLRGQRRFHCLVKSPRGPHDWAVIRGLYTALCDHALAKHVRLFLDLDPISML